MKKMFLLVAMVIGTFLGANAQSIFVVRELNAWNYSVTANNFTFTTLQSGTTISFNPPPGGYSQDYSGALVYGYTNADPSPLAPVFINVPAGYTTKATNNYTTTQKIAVQIAIRDPNSGGIFYYTGPGVTVAAGATATLTIPAVLNYKFSSPYPAAADGTFMGYPIVVTFDIVAVQ
jgi:hypothetical protein